MKKNVRYLNVGSMFLMMLLFFASCNKEENPGLVDQENFELVELQASDETEHISEEILNIAEDVYATDEIATSSRNSYSSDYLPSCVSITTIINGNTKEKTIDFGTGCELPNGNILSGTIHLYYSKDMDMATKTLNLNLENFTFNGVAIDGNATVVRMRLNANGNPHSDAQASFDATWPNGTTATFSGERKREWIEGYGSGFWGDNVVLISGTRSYTNRLGTVILKKTLVPLRREWSCRFIVSGVLEITRNENTAILDFGDGTCDAIGLLSNQNGSSKEIFLRRFKK